jgi:hypothetical protein
MFLSPTLDYYRNLYKASISATPPPTARPPSAKRNIAMLITAMAIAGVAVGTGYALSRRKLKK